MKNKTTVNFKDTIAELVHLRAIESLEDLTLHEQNQLYAAALDEEIIGLDELFIEEMEIQFTLKLALQYQESCEKIGSEILADLKYFLTDIINDAISFEYFKQFGPVLDQDELIDRVYRTKDLKNSNHVDSIPF